MNTLPPVLTVWQPWATLIVENLKPYEFRDRALPSFVKDRRVVVHAAKRPMKTREIREILDRLYAGRADGMNVGPAIDLLEKVWRGELELPTSAALGSAVFAGSQPCNLIFPDDPQASAEKHGWRMVLVRKWAEPVKASGLQGFWRWPQPLGCGQ